MNGHLDSSFYRALNKLDWGRIRRVMEALDWKWAYVEGAHIPQTYEMEGIVHGLYTTLKEERSKKPYFTGPVSSGGFQVSLEDGEKSVRIDFIVEGVSGGRD